MIADLIFLANLLTAWAARAIASEFIKIRIKSEMDDTTKGNKLAFCIAGLLNQPNTAFRHIVIPGYDKVYVSFSQFGWNPRWMGWALEKLKKDDDIMLGISIGAQAAWNAGASRTILINPCSTPKILQKRYYWLTKILSPLAWILSYALGWISFIPFIPAQDGRYSIALLVDQLFWMSHGRCLENLHTRAGIIISDKDEFLENKNIIKYYAEKAPHASIVSIDTMHARIGDPKDAPKYQAAINYLLKQE